MDKKKLLILLTSKDAKDPTFQGALTMCLTENIYDQKINNLAVVSNNMGNMDVDHIIKSRVLVELNFFNPKKENQFGKMEEKQLFFGKVAKA